MWIKNFRRKKLQSSMIFIIIILCSMLMNASISILTSLDKPFQDFAKKCNSATAVLSPYSGKDDEVVQMGKQFNELPNVERVEYSRGHYISEELTFKNKKIESFLRLTEYNDAVYNKIHYIHGDKSESANLKENECIVPACISNKYKINTGDIIKLQLENRQLIYTVKGIYSETYNMFDAFSSNILVKKLPVDVTGGLNIILYGKAGVSGSEIEESYREKYDGQMNGEIYTLQYVIDENLLPSNILGGVFLALGIIMLFVSCIIINFMIRNAMITDAKTIAVYKTIGYTSSDILKMYLTFYFVIVSAGCVIGICSSVYLSNTILRSIFKNMGQVVNNNILSSGIFCYVVIVGFVIGIIYSIISKTKRVKPVYALNGMTNTSTKKRKKYKGNFKMQFSAFGIALRTLARNKKSAVGIIITCIVTIFSINFAIITLDVANTMKNNNDYWLGVDKSDAIVDLTNSNQLNKVKKAVEQDSRVDYYVKSNLSTRVTLKWKKGMKSTSLVAFVFDDYSKAKLPIIKGRNPKASNEIAISGRSASELNKTVGDYIEVYLTSEKKVDLLITGIFQSYFEMGETCRMTTDTFTNNNYDFQYTSVSIYLNNHEDKKTFIKDLEQNIGASGKVYDRTEAFSSIMDTIVTPQKSAIPPVVALILFVGAINIFCIVLLKNANSERSNGIYKCIGYSTWHLIFANFYYVSMVAVASITITIPIIIAVYPSIMKESLAMFGFLKYPVNYNFFHIALANLVVLMFFIISTLISSRSLKKVSVRDLVQE